MIDNERNPSTSYKIEVLEEGEARNRIYKVNTYARDAEEPVEGIIGYYRYDLLPQWMTTAMAMLDMASHGSTLPISSIDCFGSKVGNQYWLMAEQVYGRPNGKNTGTSP